MFRLRRSRPAHAPALALALVLALPGVARADGFNCGNRVITTGMELYEVRDACGEPAQVTRTTILQRPVIWRYGRPYYASEDFVPVPAETWIYDFGSTRLMRKLRFVDGVLTDIATLGYGGHAP